MTSLAADDDPRVDALYALPLDEFVAARDGLARELRAAGAKDDAALVKKLRKPSRVAWAVNQVARRAPDRIDAVLAAGAALRDAQQSALGATAGPELRDAVRARQAAVDAAVTIAVDAIGPGGAGVRETIARTFQAASIDDDAGRALAHGRLAEELEPPDVFATLEPAAGPAANERGADAAAERAARAAVEAATAAWEAARARAAELDRAARVAADAAAEARRAEHVAAGALDEARARWDREQSG